MTITVSQWQTTLQLKCSTLIAACLDLRDHIDKLAESSDITTADVEELAAITFVKLERMNQSIEDIFKN